MSPLSTEKTPEFDVKLTKAGTEVGLILCNGQGVHDPMAITQEQQSRSAIKIASGDTKHSDYEPPYATDEVRDWSIGRGMNDADLEEGRYFDSRTAFTSNKGKIMIGPQYKFATGLRTAQTNMWKTGAAAYHKIDLYGDNWGYSTRFQASSSYLLNYVYIPLTRKGTATGHIRIYSDNAGVPDTILDSIAITAWKEKGITELVRTGVGVSVVSGTYYHVAVVGSDSHDEDNHISVICHNEGASPGFKLGAGGWAASDYAPYYRVTVNDSDYRAHFTKYLEIPHVVLDYDDNSAPKIFMNGDFGQATAGTSTVLTDSTKSWTVDEWIGWQLILYDGRGAEALVRHFDITDNDATSITVAGFEVTPDESTYYSITNGDKWYEITGHGLTEGPITDVKTIGDIVYIMRGDTNDILFMRYPRLATGGFELQAGITGSFVAHALDSDRLQRVWIATRKFLDKSGFPIPWGSKTGVVYPLSLNADQLLLNPDFELTSSWANVGSPSTSERSSEQARNGTYSWKFVATADEEGITQTVNTTIGDYYLVHASIYVDAGSANGGKIVFAGVEIGTVDAASAGSWVYLTGVARATATSHECQFLSDGGVATIYIDDARVREYPTYLRTGEHEKFTNLIAYGEPERLWALTTSGIYMESQGNMSRIPIDEMRNSADNRNGIAATTYDVYLLFSFMNGGVERYYKSNLDDIGPDRDEGLPSSSTVDRRGNITAMKAYPTGVFMAVDGGENQSIGYGSILFYNNTGYHEMWRSDTAGKRIRGLHIQPVDGDHIDRVWINHGSDILWIPVDKNPQTNANYRYNYEAVMETPWIFRGKHDVLKFFDEIKLFCRVITTTTIDVTAQYKADEETSWTTIGTFDTAPDDTLTIGTRDKSAVDNGMVEAKRFKYRLIIRTTNSSVTPLIEAASVDLIEDIPVKDSWTYQFLLRDTAISKTGTPQYNRVEDVITQLNTWKASPIPIYQEAVHSSYDGKWGPIVGFTTRAIKLDPQSQEEELVGTITVIEA